MTTNKDDKKKANPEKLKIKDLPEEAKPLSEEDLNQVAGGTGCSGMCQDPKSSFRRKKHLRRLDASPPGGGAPG